VLAVISDRKVGVDNFSYIGSVNGNYTLSTASPNTYQSTPGVGTHTRTLGPDGRADLYTAEILSSREYSAYGAELPGYSYTTSGEYRYQFQNQEVDEEFWGGAVSYKYRIEDPRLGRFFSVDPLAPKYPHNSTYAFSENRVIDKVELEGLEMANPRYMGKSENPVLWGVSWGFVDFLNEGLQFVTDDMWDTETYLGMAKTIDLMAPMNLSAESMLFKIQTAQTVEKTIKEIPEWDASDWSYNLTKLSLSLLSTKGVQTAIKLGGSVAITRLQKFDDLFKPMVMNSYSGRTFNDIIKGAEKITGKNSKNHTDLRVNGSVRDSWGQLMAYYNKTVDDLQFSNDGSTSYFVENNTTYALYNQASTGDFVGMTISSTTKINGIKEITKVRFTQE
jgi:RHS repeat-associated protein